MTAATVPQLRTDRSIERLARIFHALSDETRLRIVARLLAGEQCVCDLTEMLDIAQSRLSFHMKALKEAGLVSDRRHGRWIHYSLVPEALGELQELLAQVTDRAAKAGTAPCCG